MSEEKVDGGKRIATSNEQRVTSDEKGERDEAVGRGPRARRKVDEQRGCRERFSTVPAGSPSTSSG